MRILFRMINESMFVKDDQEDSMISTPLMAGSLKYIKICYLRIYPIHVIILSIWLHHGGIHN